MVLEKALAAAEAEPDPVLRPDLIHEVALVWARRRPEDVSRAVKNLSIRIRRQEVLDDAAWELKRRSTGRAAEEAARAKAVRDLRTRLETAPPGVDRGQLVAALFRLDADEGRKATEIAHSPQEFILITCAVAKDMSSQEAP